MYINLTLFKNTDLSADQLLNLVYIKQVAPEMINVEFLKEFEERGYIKYNKRKNASQNVQELVRLDKKGKDLLVKLSFEGTVDEECEKLGAWLISQYKNTDGKIVKNKTEILRRLQWYKTITGISGNFLALLISCAIKDTYNNDCGMTFYEYKKENPRAMLSNMLDNLFFSPTSHFDSHYVLSKSPLYAYYEDNEEYIKKVWEENLDEDGSRL